ncbi:hypothetical protein Q8A67_001496 [Cirrhinus molitorella]|uniref:Uncharacterized protein n=1 Tax=Cirrhinus molitorella TaxID=172907 RepID=A0AA88TXT5_9TELE|nr:hypothetical protein Q8A67_001496 [Cirrhinus molitorella]
MFRDSPSPDLLLPIKRIRIGSPGLELLIADISERERNIVQRNRRFLVAKAKPSGSSGAASSSATELAAAETESLPGSSGGAACGLATNSNHRAWSSISVLTPFCRTMLHERKRNVVILAHEKGITTGLDMDAFVSLFAQKSRRLMH